MRFENLPADEHDRRIVLSVESRALTELLIKFEGDDTVSAFVTGTIHNEIELIDRCLELGVDHVKAEQYEKEAKETNKTTSEFF